MENNGQNTEKWKYENPSMEWIEIANRDINTSLKKVAFEQRLEEGKGQI